MRKIENLDRDKVSEILDRLSFFEDFNTWEKKLIPKFHSNFNAYSVGEYLITEGKHDKSFYILISGKVVIVKGEYQEPIAELEPGEFFGEVSFLTGAPRTTSVVAQSTSIAIKVDDDLFEQLNPQIREKIKDKILEKLVKRLDHMNDLFLEISKQQD